MSVKTNILGEVINGILNERIEIVDLSMILNDDTPTIKLPEPFANTGGFKFKPISNYDEKGPAFYWNDFIAGEHVGTHFDAPIHWISGREHDGVDTMPMENMVGEACVIDVRRKVDADPDYCLTLEDIKQFEDQYGQIPKHSWVLIHTGWSEVCGRSAKNILMLEKMGSHIRLE